MPYTGGGTLWSPARNPHLHTSPETLEFSAHFFFLLTSGHMVFRLFCSESLESATGILGFRSVNVGNTIALFLATPESILAAPCLSLANEEVHTALYA